MQHLPHCTFFFASHVRMPTLLRRACCLWDLGTWRAGGSRMILVLPTRARPTFFALHVAWYIFLRLLEEAGSCLMCSQANLGRRRVVAQFRVLASWPLNS
jgi:hypothetical protein